jgi:hypothetical protein
MPVYYNPQSLEKDILDIPVSSIYISASEAKEAVTDETPGKSTSSQTRNHWMLHLATTANDSVELNPTVGTNKTLRLEISRPPDIDRASLNKQVELAVSHGLYVRNIIELLQKHKHDYYRLTPEGKGLCHWIKTTLALLFSVGYLVDESDIQEAKMCLQNMRDGYGQPVASQEQLPMEVGTFFDPEEENVNS